jgi:hypothetical protein
MMRLCGTDPCHLYNCSSVIDMAANGVIVFGMSVSFQNIQEAAW